MTAYILGISAFGTTQLDFANPRADMWWSAWLFKPGLLSGADYILLLWAGMLLFSIVISPLNFRQQIGLPYIGLLSIIGIYLILGLLYNFFVYLLWKPYLFDLKIALWLSVPVILPIRLGFSYEELRRLILRCLVLGCIGGLLDFGIALTTGRYSFPMMWGIPFPRELLPVMVIGILPIAFSISWRYLLVAAVIVGAECTSALGRLNFAYFLAASTACVLAYVFFTLRRNAVRWMLAFGIIGLFYGVQIIYVFGAVRTSLIEMKSDGLNTRQVQFQNLMMNGEHNLPLAVGKGLGATWYEYIPIPDDIYAVGDSLGNGVAANMLEPIRFIFHTPLASMLYKFGIIGSMMLISFVLVFYERCIRSLGYYPRAAVVDRLIACSCGPYLFFCLNWYGMEKDAMLCSLIVAANVARWNSWRLRRNCRNRRAMGMEPVKILKKPRGVVAVTQ